MLEIMLASSLEKPGVWREPSPLEETSLSVFLGETVSFQIALRGEKEDGKRKIKAVVSACGEEKTGGELPGIRIREVLPVMCRRSCNPDSKDEDYLFYDERMAPDILRDIDGDEISLTGEWQAVWVDVLPGKNCGGGRYRLDFQITAREAAPVECGVDIRVIGSELPPLAIPHTEWFHCDGIINYYGVNAFSDEFWRIFENFLKVYVNRGCNTMYVPVLTPALDTEQGLERTTVQLADVTLSDGAYEFDFSNLERFLDICLAGGIEYFEICHLFTQWGAEAAPKVEAWADGERKRIFGWETPSNDPEYLRFLGALLPALKELLNRRGLLEKTFFHISDEPNLTSARYQTAQSQVRRLLEGCTILEAVSDYEYYAKGLVDIPVCAINYIEPFLEKRPPKLWSYYCCAQTVEVPNRFISMPSWRNRIYGILLYWHHIDGFLHWGFNFYNSILSRRQIDPYQSVDADGGFPAGDPFVIYPGKNGIPEESLRLMVQDEAISDYRALCMLEEYIGREKVMELIRQEAGGELSFRNYPKNAAFILRLRGLVNKMLEAELEKRS